MGRQGFEALQRSRADGLGQAAFATDYDAMSDKDAKMHIALVVGRKPWPQWPLTGRPESQV